MLRRAMASAVRGKVPMLLGLQVVAVAVISFFCVRSALAIGTPADCYIWIWKNEMGAWIHPDPNFRCTIGQCDQPVVVDCEYEEFVSPGSSLAFCRCGSGDTCTLVFFTNGVLGQSFGTGMCNMNTCPGHCPLNPTWSHDPYVQRALDCPCTP
jgi:hypothetical protein